VSRCLAVLLRKLRKTARRYGYRGLKIFTSLSLRFQDFQRTNIEKHSVKNNIFWKMGAFKTDHRFIQSLKIANYPSI